MVPYDHKADTVQRGIHLCKDEDSQVYFWNSSGHKNEVDRLLALDLALSHTNKYSFLELALWAGYILGIAIALVVVALRSP